MSQNLKTTPISVRKRNNIKFDLKIEENYNKAKDSVLKVEKFLSDQLEVIRNGFEKTRNEINKVVEEMMGQ